MTTVTTKGGAEIYYKDWGTGQPLAYSAAWCMPARSPTAQSGSWKVGLGINSFETIKRELESPPFIAGDLGVITPDVVELRDACQLTGMRVLQFAFDGNSANPHQPHKYLDNLVASTATQDNNTARGWSEPLSDSQQRTVWQYLGRPPSGSHDIPAAWIRLALSSNAALAISPLQDLLKLSADARMNVPGVPRGLGDGDSRRTC